ncbi:hypothetical protein B0H14DRAFT_2730610, partial [Mycena olivaceomarginata]
SETANEKEAALVLVLMSRLFVSLEASDFKDTSKHNELQKLLMKHQVRVNRAFMRRLTLWATMCQQFQADSKNRKKTVAGAKGAAGRKKSTTGNTQDGVPVENQK